MRAGWRPLRVGLQLVAGAGVTVILLAAAEFLGGRLLAAKGLVGGDDFIANAVLGIRLAPHRNPAPLVEDPGLMWRNEPLARRRQPVNPRALGDEDAIWTIANGSRGYRGPEVGAPDHPADLYRILCVGDSITFGFNVDQGAPFPRQLERMLRAQYPFRRFEVINAGVPGWSWAQGMRFLETEGLALRPDLVVMAHGTNDQFFATRITDGEHLRTAGALLQLPLYTLVARTNLFRVARWLTARDGAPSADSPGCQEQIHRTGSCHRVALEEIEGHVRRARQLVADAGAELLVLNLDFVRTQAVRGVRAAVDRDGIAFLDLAARFRELERADEVARARSRDLAAPGPAGHAVGRPRRVLLRCLAAEPGSAMSVQVDSFLAPGFRFVSSVYDDGTHGDEVAGDHVFSIAFEIPADVFSLTYLFCRDGTCEFTPLPPNRSSMEKRMIDLGDRDLVGPIDVLGKRFLMVEQTHPNERGHAIIAEAIAQELERLPAFARVAQVPVPGSAAGR